MSPTTMQDQFYAEAHRRLGHKVTKLPDGRRSIAHCEVTRQPDGRLSIATIQSPLRPYAGVEVHESEGDRFAYLPLPGRKTPVLIWLLGTSRSGVVLDAEAVAGAVEFLGLRRDVSIRWWGNPFKSPTIPGETVSGHCMFWRGRHVIDISADLDADTASRVLWHELQHAAQAERPVKGVHYYKRGEAFLAEYEDAQTRHGYDDNPLEIEARVAEDVYGPELALARPAP